MKIENGFKKIGITGATVLAFGLFSPFHGLAQEVAVKNGETIAFLGDSITTNGWQAPGGYVHLVINGLEANGVKATALPAGIPGNKSDQMLQRLDQDVLSKKPTWMTLSCGVNDVWHGPKGIPLDQYKKNIEEIIDRCGQAGVKVMILTSTMIGEDQANPNNQKLIDYNDFLRGLAREKHLLLADLNADMQAAVKECGASPKVNPLTSDGVHMNPAGNQVMATGVLKGFGLSPAQIEKAGERWLDIPNVCEVSVKMTLRDFKRLNAAAVKQNHSASELANIELTKAIRALPGQ